MKSKILFIESIIALLAIIAGCDDVNSLHQKYLDEGPKIYLGKPDSVIVKSGYKQIRLIWENNADVKITETLITYNFGRDSVLIPFNRKEDGRQKDSLTIALEPGDYIFDIRNLNSSGNLRSLPVTGLNGKSYGDNYQLLLETRKFTTSIEKNTLTIKWDYSVPYNCSHSIIRYVDRSQNTHQQVTRLIPNEEIKTTITGVETGDIIEVTSAYKPEQFFIDFIESPFMSIKIDFSSGLIDHTKCTQYIGIPYDNTTQHSGAYRFKNMFDGNTNTIWISSSPDVDPTNGGNAQNNYSYPLSFTVDLSSEIMLTHLEYIGWEGLSQAPKKFEVWGTNKIEEGKPNSYWTTTIPGNWQNDWHKLADCEAHDNSQPGFKFEINPDRKNVRYLRILVYELFKPIPGNIRVGISELMLYKPDLVAIIE